MSCNDIPADASSEMIPTTNPHVVNVSKAQPDPPSFLPNISNPHPDNRNAAAV